MTDRSQACPRCGACLMQIGEETDTLSESIPPRDAALITLGEFTLLEEIGRGGMGRVFRAHQPVLNRDVALKVLAAPTLAVPDARRRFQSEAEATAGMEHPHIVTIYEAGEIEGQPFISMQQVEGGSLAERFGDFRASDPRPSRRGG